MSNKKQTSHRIASKAGEILDDPNASNIQKRLAASALAQSRSGKESSEAVQTKAAKVLNSEKFSELVTSPMARMSQKSNYLLPMTR